ncbi:MAG: helix-turn-helix transcriptional regulator [Clostridia bacterium]|nr:helix-turn-helix transcriptional regulator [Clostridia bacterium]
MNLQPVFINHFDARSLQPGEAEGPWMLPGYQFCYVTEGAGIIRTRSGAFSVNAGEGFLAFPLKEFSCEATGAVPLEYLRIAFDGADVEELCKDVGLSPEEPVFADGEDFAIRNALLALWEILPEQHNRKYEVLSRFYAVFAQFPLKEDKNYVEKAKNYILSRYPYPIRIENLANHVGLDRTYLFKLFVKEEGVSPQEFLIRYRLSVAALQLKQTDLSAAQIAASCGFGDAPSFCKHFKARYGCSPLAYRKSSEK